jgi:2-polyprenyl-6-methoxyphenol hydroxylase-like FAD-dependent oxidoreductase
VLVLEREQHFRDRIRGEAVHVWGTVETRAVGIHELLLDRCAHELGTYIRYEDGGVVSSRDLIETTSARSKELTFFHPEMQATLVDCARASGAEVWQGARATRVLPGDTPQVVFQLDGADRQVAARLVVAADGRHSSVRTWSGFEVRHDPDNLVITGVLVSCLPADETAFHHFSRPGAAWNMQFIPVGQQRYRAYFVSGDRRRHPRIGGKSGASHLLAYARDSGVPPGWLETMRLDGPLASFEGASCWVDRPYRDGVALIGDAAAAAEPCFGNGQSLALRDVRVLNQYLMTDPDWDSAARRYAATHDEYFHSLNRLEHWYAEAWYSVDPEKQHVRDQATAAQKRGYAPDNIGRGPDQPADDEARMRFLGY